MSDPVLNTHLIVKINPFSKIIIIVFNNIQVKKLFCLFMSKITKFLAQISIHYSYSASFWKNIPFRILIISIIIFIFKDDAKSGGSRGSFSWVKLVSQNLRSLEIVSCSTGLFLWFKLAGQTHVSNSKEKLVVHCCASFSWVKFLGRVCVSFEAP